MIFDIEQNPGSFIDDVGEFSQPHLFVLEDILTSSDPGWSTDAHLTYKNLASDRENGQVILGITPYDVLSIGVRPLLYNLDDIEPFDEVFVQPSVEQSTHTGAESEGRAIATETQKITRTRYERDNTSIDSLKSRGSPFETSGPESLRPTGVQAMHKLSQVATEGNSLPSEYPDH